MITYFLFDLLPYWLKKPAKLARQSAIYQFLARLWHRWAELVRGSFCARLWAGSDRLRNWTQTSLLCAWADSFIRWMTAFMGKSLGWAAYPIAGSRLGATLRRIPRYNFAWLFGLVFLAVCCCPADLWRDPAGLTLSSLLFMSMLAESWMADRDPFRVKDLGLWLFGFVLASALAVVVAADRSEALKAFRSYLTAFLFCVSLVGTVHNRGRLMSILGFIHLTLMLTSLYAVAQRFLGAEITATLQTPDNYAAFIVLTFPVCLVFCCNIVDRRLRTLAAATLAIPAAVLLMTDSPWSWISFALTAVVFLALWDKRLLPLVPVAAIIALSLLPVAVFDRLLDLGAAAPARHGPMLYLQLRLEMGLPGIVSFLALHFGTIRRAIRAIKLADPLLRWVLIACVSSLAGVSLLGVAAHIWSCPRILFAFFILLGVTLAAVKLAEESK